MNYEDQIRRYNLPANDSPPESPTVGHWGCSILFWLAGVGLLALNLTGAAAGPTPEEELLCVEGVPTHAFVTKQKALKRCWDYLECTIGGQTFQYSSDDPNYDSVLAAVKSGQPLRAWVSPPQASTIGTRGIVPLYKLTWGNQTVLDYAVIAQEKENSNLTSWVVSIVISVFGASWLVFCIWRLRDCRRHTSVTSKRPQQ